MLENAALPRIPCHNVLIVSNTTTSSQPVKLCLADYTLASSLPASFYTWRFLTLRELIKDREKKQIATLAMTIELCHSTKKGAKTCGVATDGGRRPGEDRAIFVSLVFS